MGRAQEGVGAHFIIEFSSCTHCFDTYAVVIRIMYVD